MKTFKQLIAEVAEPVGDEKRFKDKHVVAVTDDPNNGDSAHKAKTSKKKRLADSENDEDLYEESDMCETCGESEDDCECEDDDEEDLDEEEMSASEVKKREEIVMSMKDKKDDLKKRYGDKWKSVMYATATKAAMKESVELDEEVIDALKDIVKKKSMKEVKFADGDKTRVDMFTASAMVKVHDALNGDNQKKFADAINKNENMFMKMMDFAMSKVGGK